MTGEVGQQDVVLILDTQGSAVVFPAIAEGRVSVRAVLDQNSGATLKPILASACCAVLISISNQIRFAKIHDSMYREIAEFKLEYVNSTF